MCIRDRPSITDRSKEATPDKQPKRVYSIRFLSQLDGTINKTVQVKVLGKFQFVKILPPTLEGLIKSYSIPTVLQKFYKVDNVTLYWNNTKLLNFMTCNSLNIPQAFENEVTNVDIVIMSKEKEIENENELRKKLLLEEKAAQMKLDLEKEREKEGEKNKPKESKNTEYAKAIAEFEKELKDATELKDSQVHGGENDGNMNIDGSDNEKSSIMKIALVGHDNKKIYVNVRNSTPFSKLAEYYRLQKQLPQAAKIQLMFDHDELNLEETVGDQDMEDEDMIEVVIK